MTRLTRVAVSAVLVVVPALLSTACSGSADRAGRPGPMTVTEAAVGASGGTDAAAYLVVHNPGARDALIDVSVLGESTVAAGDVTMHRTDTSSGVSAMRRVERLTVPAGGELRLDPGGSHLMLDDLPRPVEVGDAIRLRLRFEHASPVVVTAEAVPLAELPERLHR